MVFQRLETWIRHEIPNLIILRSMPPAMISGFLAVFPYIAGDEYSKWAGVNTLDTFMRGDVILLLIVSTLTYMFIVFEKEWKGYWHWKKRLRIIHRIAFGALGVAAALIPYVGTLGTYFFVMVDHDSGGKIHDYLPYLYIYAGVFSFIAINLFNGILGKGFFFKIPPINRTPLKRYLPLEYKIRKRLPKDVNKLIFTDD